MCHSFLNVTAKVTLKSVHFDEVTDKNELAHFSWLTVQNDEVHVTMPQSTNTVPHGNTRNN